MVMPKAGILLGVSKSTDGTEPNMYRKLVPYPILWFGTWYLVLGYFGFGIGTFPTFKFKLNYFPEPVPIPVPYPIIWFGTRYLLFCYFEIGNFGTKSTSLVPCSPLTRFRVILSFLTKRGSITFFHVWKGLKEFLYHRTITISHVFNNHYVMV